MRMEDAGIRSIYTTSDGETFRTSIAAMHHIRLKRRYQRMEERERRIRERVANQESILIEKLKNIFGDDTNLINIIVKYKYDIKDCLRKIKRVI